MIFFRVIIILLLTASSLQNFAQGIESSIILLDNDFYKIVIDKDLSFFIHKIVKDSDDLLVASSNSLFLVEINGESPTRKFEINNYVVDYEKTIFGISKVIRITAKDSKAELLYNQVHIVPDKFNNVIIISSELKNISSKTFSISSVSPCNLHSNAKNIGEKNIFDFWTFQPESTPERQNWIKPLTMNFFQRNYQGMNASDYGGGIPLIDLWTKNQGIAIASIETKPSLISLPIQVNDGGVYFGLEDSINYNLTPQQIYSLPTFAIILHNGDFFNALQIYSYLIQSEGINFVQCSNNALEPEWCAWGYGRDFSIIQILESLDEVGALGIKWVTIDDGWQSADGDWDVSNEKFKNGEKDFVALIDSIHSKGMKVRLWWVPLTASDSSYNAEHFPKRITEYGMNIQSTLAKNHPEWFILDNNGERFQVSWWNSFQLCPALDEVIEYYKSFVKKAILEWDIDGFKIDGQNINLIPPCYNPLHNHTSPLESSEATPTFLNAIYKTAKNLKPDFLIQVCPCGTNYSIYNLPYLDQVVASDPLNSEQVRIKGKTFKAILGSKVSYSGDHVELTNRRWDDLLNKSVIYKEEDFASTIGIGGVPSTKFTSPNIVQSDSPLMLSNTKKEKWLKWLNIYYKYMLSKGEYINLYDIAFDKPETHLIKKGDELYYSLFADSFQGSFEFRGLEPNKKYKITDILTGNEIGKVDNINPNLIIEFNNYLILQGRPF